MMFWLGFASALGIAGIGWLAWYLAPLGCPETGAGRRTITRGVPR